MEEKKMTVQEAGALGGHKRATSGGGMSVSDAGKLGGARVKELYGHTHYLRIGKLGGARIKELARLGREAEAKANESS